MKLGLLAVGRMKAGPERELMRRYLDRAEGAARGVGLSGVQVVEIEESRARSAEQRKRDEAAMLSSKMAKASVVLLDERGKPVSSLDLAQNVARARDGGAGTMIFAIGGPDGFDPALLAAHRSICFGAITLPHQLVRVVLAEQLYRVTTILAGHPYHRA